jgi:hypothetical protein
MVVSQGVCHAESLPTRRVALACRAPAAVPPIHPGVFLERTIRLPALEQAVQMARPLRSMACITRASV